MVLMQNGSFFDRYEVLDNAIQRLGEYENIGTVEEFKALKEGIL